MKNTIDILVLGDSAFSGLGGRFLNALDYFPLQRQYDRPVRFFNGAMTGMTSADAAIHIKELTGRNDYDALIVYLGNCDPCGFGYIKSKKRFLNHWLSVRIENFLYRRKNPLSKRNEPYRFREGLLPSKEIRRVVSPEDFVSFLSMIIKQCRDSNIPLILINPISKVDFPPCGNLGNSIFYRIFNISDDRSFDNSGPAAGLAEASEAHPQIISESAGIEQRIIAKNNLAAIYFNRGDLRMAADLLREVSSEENPLYPVILFNRALTYSSMGEEGRAKEAFEEAHRSDKGTYRISGQYRRAISEILRKDKEGVIEIDLEKHLSSDDMIDYCHPDEEGHRKIFSVISGILEGLFGLDEGEDRPEIQCIPLNPDRYAGFRSNFFEHFKITGSIKDDHSAGLAEAAQKSDYRDILKRTGPAVGHMFYLLRHPLFGAPEFLRLSPPFEPAERGRFPESFGIRHMLEIYRDSAADPGFLKKFRNVRQLILLPEKIDRWWSLLQGRGPGISKEKIKELSGKLDHQRILGRSLSLLDHILEIEPVVFNRYRTISYWFFRESLIFGSTSHWTIFTERTALRDLIDTSLFMLTGNGNEPDSGNEFYRILMMAEIILDIHREFLSPVANRLYSVDREWFVEYKARITDLRRLGY